MSYSILDERGVREYVQKHEGLVAVLGSQKPEEWAVEEVGDGNLNMVYIVSSDTGSVCVKQALPYVRIVPTWPLPYERIYYEAEYLAVAQKHCPGSVPETLHFNKDLALLVMECLRPHTIVRKRLIAGESLASCAATIGSFLGRMLFRTSDLSMPSQDKRKMTAFFSGNTALCSLTEAVVFTDPYVANPSFANRWTTPQLDADVAKLQGNVSLRLEVNRLKHKFLTQSQALLHGDLHTGSAMATSEDCRVIDSEFAFVGPSGFDIGAVLGNLVIAYIAQRGYGLQVAVCRERQDRILDMIHTVWNDFQSTFISLWNNSEECKGELFPVGILPSDPTEKAAVLKQVQAEYMEGVYRDSIGFAGCKMIRRVVGVAHVEDLECIEDPDVRAECERRVLGCGTEMILGRGELQACSIEAFTSKIVIPHRIN